MNPMPASYINDPKHWRDRADEMRAFVDEFENPAARDSILRIANDYEKLARRAERRSSDSKATAAN